MINLFINLYIFSLLMKTRQFEMHKKKKKYRFITIVTRWLIHFIVSSRQITSAKIIKVVYTEIENKLTNLCFTYHSGR